MKSLGHSSLARRVLIASSLLFALPLLIYFFLVFRYDYKAKLEETVRNFQSLGWNRSLILSDLTKYNFRTLEMVEEFLTFAREEKGFSQEKINDVFKAFATTGHFDTISYFNVDSNGQYICTFSSDANKINNNYTSFHYVQNAIIYDQISFLAFGTNSQQRRFYVSKTVYSKKTHELTGVLNISTSVSELLKKVILSENIPYPIHFSLLTEDQVIFESSHPDFSLRTLTKLTSNQIQNIQATHQFAEAEIKKNDIQLVPIENTLGSEKLVELHYDNKVYIAVFMPIPGTDLTLLLHADKSQVYQSENRSLFIVLTVFLIVFSAGASTTLWLTKRMSKPLDSLCVVMTEVSQGNLQARYRDDKLGFEINNLGHIFNGTMTKLIRNMEVAENERVLKETLEKELKIGYEIQTTILPRNMPVFENIEIAARYTPAKKVGGDFYDVFIKKETPNDRLFITIADAAGKGISACLYSLCLRSMLRSYCMEHHDIATIMNLTNNLFCQDTENTGMFVTVLTTMFDPNTRQLKYCSCGHNPGLIFRKNGTWIRLENPGMAMGVIEFNIQNNYIQQLEKGDLVILYTDGVTETPTLSDELYGEKRLMRFIEKHCQESVDSIADNLLQELAVFSEDAPQFDDITIIMMRIL